MSPLRITPMPGQESVWDYPRPPRLEPFFQEIEVIFAGITIAKTSRSVRVLETSTAPVYYIPREDVAMEFLRRSRNESFCDFKGATTYYDVQVEGRVAVNAAWCYPTPTPGFAPLRNRIAFSAKRMDRCLVGGEIAIAEPGSAHGGWITKNIVGPFRAEIAAAGF